jgi:hypothetical protein
MRALMAVIATTLGAAYMLSAAQDPTIVTNPTEPFAMRVVT